MGSCGSVGSGISTPAGCRLSLPGWLLSAPGRVLPAGGRAITAGSERFHHHQAAAAGPQATSATAIQITAGVRGDRAAGDGSSLEGCDVGWSILQTIPAIR